MSLSELIAGVGAAEKTLTVYNPAGDEAAQLADHFADRNVTVRSATTGSGPANFAVLSHAERFLSAVDVDALLASPESLSPGFDPNSYRPILDELDETLFTSYDRDRMLAASREIEDRAWRVGAGELHAGFQTGDTLRPQLDVYRRLGDRGELDVHAYIYPRGSVVRADTFQLHLARTEEVRRSWFTVFDGNGVDDYKCALVAEETDSGFTGFWTYDPSTVDYVVSHLETRYAIVESDGSGHDSSPARV